MKGVAVSLLFCLLFSLASASVSVGNNTIKTTYSPYEILSGNINITVEDIAFNTNITSSRGDSVPLKDILNAHNFLYYECSTSDCSNDYIIDSPQQTKTFSNIGRQFGGLLLNGQGVELISLNLTIESDFSPSVTMPLSVEFFEDNVWEFREFSEDYTQALPDYGCTNPIQLTTPSLPILSSTYCSEILIRETGAMMVGAKLSGSDDKKVTMTLFNAEGIYKGDCDYLPSSGDDDEDQCEISAKVGGIQGVFPTGNYFVCVGPEISTSGIPIATEYLLYAQDNPTEFCGFSFYEDFSFPPKENRTKNYGIFARPAKFAAGGIIELDQDFLSSIKDSANSLLSSRYANDCSDGCVLPIEIMANVPQSVVFSGIQLNYITVDGDRQDDKIYAATSVPATVSFSDSLDFFQTGFNISSAGLYELFLGADKIYSNNFTVLPAPIITQLNPLTAPAGIPTPFVVGVEFSGNQSLTYNWDFGDGVKETTDKPVVSHAYSNISSYNLKVEIAAGGNASAPKTFLIQTISPKDYINETLAKKKNDIANSINDISKFSEWIALALNRAMNVTQIQDDLSKIEKKISLATYDSDYLAIAKDLVALNVPQRIYIKSKTSSVYLSDYETISVVKVAEYTGEDISGVAAEDYNQAILRWQDEFVTGLLDVETIYYDINGNPNRLFSVYNLAIENSDSVDSYLFMNKPLGVVEYKNDVKVRSLGTDYSLVALAPGERLTTEFYSYQDLDFFISPDTKYLVLDAGVNEECNYNFICESGEDYKGCRTDCKPVGLSIFWIVVLIIVALLWYMALQYWYEVYYEKKLFGDRRHLYNLLMFIANTKQQEKTDAQIRNMLLSKGWSSERITYAINKSVGKRTGMPQLIPFDKIQNLFRKKKAKKQMQASGSAVVGAPHPGILPLRRGYPEDGITNGKQQSWGNINKSSFQNEGKRR